MERIAFILKPSWAVWGINKYERGTTEQGKRAINYAIRFDRRFRKKRAEQASNWLNWLRNEEKTDQSSALHKTNVKENTKKTRNHTKKKRNEGTKKDNRSSNS